jgi:hypothetical protein
VADDAARTPKTPRKAKAVPPPPPPEPAAQEEAGGPPPREQRRAPGRGGSSSRDADRTSAPRPGGERSGAPQRGRAPRAGLGVPEIPRQTRRSTPATPGGARGKPVGAERARRREDAPARRPAAKTIGAPRPNLPTDEKPHLPKPVRKDLERTLGPGRRTDEVALALSIGSQAIDEGALPVALEYLAWAKDQAPRVGAIREAYGVARYLTEDYAGALTELQAYARISGRNDQNHVIADCHRALGRDLERIEEPARSLLDDDRAPADRRAEAAIVLAAALGDAGRASDGLDVLGGVLATRRDRDLEHHLRVRSLVADLAIQVGDHDTARRQLEVLLASDDTGSFEAQERLDTLDA